MLKGFVSGEEKDIVRIPMKGKNLFDINATDTDKGYLYHKYLSENGGVSTATSSCVSEYIDISDYGTITVSGMNETGSAIISLCFYDVSKNYVSGGKYNRQTVCTYAVPNGAKYCRFTYIEDSTACMLNAGETALPYEPYGYQEGWEVRDSQDRLIWGREDELQTATGTLPFKGYALPVKVKSLLGNAVQNGTPAPSPVNPNLVDPSATVPGYQESDGNIHTPSSGNERTTDWIPFTTSALYAIVSGSNSGNINWVLYDSSKQPLYFQGPTFTPNTVITISRESYSTAAFIRISWTNAANQPICVTTEQRSEYIAFDPNPPGPVIPEMCGVRTGNVMPAGEKKTVTINDITVESDGYGHYHVYGTSTADVSAEFSLISGFTTPISISNGGQGTLSFFNTQATKDVRFVFYNGATKIDDWGLTPTDRTNTVYNAIGNQYVDGVRITVSSGTTVDMILSPEFTNDGVLPTEFEPYGWKVPLENRGENLFDKTSTDTTNGYVSNSYIRNSGEITSNTGYNVSEYIAVTPETDYTIAHGGATTPRAICWYDSDKQYISGANFSGESTTVSIPANGRYVRFSILKSAISEIMLSEGSTPKPYSTYLNATIPVYLGEVPTVRRVKKLVLDGTEDWVGNSKKDDEEIYQVYIAIASDAGTLVATNVTCSHLPTLISASVTSIKQGISMRGLSSGIICGFAYDTVGIVSSDSYTSATNKVKAFLASEYAAGHPVTVWYVLANEQTAIVNEPLCKISTYADELTTIQVHGLSAPLYGIGDYKDTLNLSTGVVTRKVKKLVLDGTENWQRADTGSGGSLKRVYMMLQRNALVYDIGKCTHYKYEYANENGNCYVGSQNDRIYFIDNTNAATTNVWKTYLAAQYQAGTPVTVWYVLNTPETETVTVPTGMTGEIEGYLTQVSTPSPTNRSVPKWNGVEETGGTYAVTVYTPPEIPTTTGQNTLTVDSNLAPSKLEVSIHAKKIHYGFKIDKSNDDSDSAVIYTHDAVTMTPAHMDFTNDRFDYGSWGNAFFVRDCYPVALNLDGTIAYRLDPDDYTKKMDGTPSDIFYELLTAVPSDWSTQWKQYYTKDANDNYELNSQGSAPTFATDTYYKLTYNSSFTGNFMMAFPKVYFRRTEDATYNYVEVSDAKLGDDWYAYAHINTNGDEVDYIYLPLFRGVIVNSKLRSIPGVIPQGGTTATEEATAAATCGSRWQMWDHSSVCLINDLMTLMSKSIDAQGKFGKGRESGYNSSDTVTYGKLQTGTLVKGGKFKGFSSSYKEVKVFGIEGFWANRWERIQGMLLDYNVWKIKMTPPYNFTGTNFVTLSNAAVPSGTGLGYLSRVQTSQYGSIPASTEGGAEDKFYRDAFYKSATRTCVAIRAGNCDGVGIDGPHFVYVEIAGDFTAWSIGASPVYK